MALKTKTQLSQLDNSWLGRPFAKVEAKALSSTELDVTWQGKPFVGAAPASGGDVTLALTGSSVTTTQGSVGLSASIAPSASVSVTQQGVLSFSQQLGLSGQSTVSQQGTLAPSAQLGIAGQVVVSQQGTLTKSAQLGLAGQVVVSQQGVLTVDAINTLVLALTGLSVPSLSGSLSVTSQLPLVGQAATTVTGQLQSAIQVGLLGQSVTASAGTITPNIVTSYTISPESGLRLMDIWQRFGLDIAAPLTETDVAAVFGSVTLTKTGTTTLTSTRAGQGVVPTDLNSVILEVWQRLALDPNNPMAASDTVITAGSIVLARAETPTTTTITRQ